MPAATVLSFTFHESATTHSASSKWLEALDIHWMETFSIPAKTKKEMMLLSVRVRREPSGRSLALTPMSANARLMRGTVTFVGLRVPFEEVRVTAGPVFLDAVFFSRGDMEAPVVSERTL